MQDSNMHRFLEFLLMTQCTNKVQQKHQEIVSWCFSQRNTHCVLCVADLKENFFFFLNQSKPNLAGKTVKKKKLDLSIGQETGLISSYLVGISHREMDSCL